MTNDMPQTTLNEQKFAPFGARLQSAREAQGLERRDAAAQLRLSEKIIVMMEKDRYAPDLPPMFIRGYLRAYSKLLQIPDEEVSKAIEPIQPKPMTEEFVASTQPIEAPVTSGSYYMQFFTIVIVLTMVGLVGTWWHSHTAAPVVAMSETQIPLPDTTTNPPVSAQAPVAPTMTPVANNTAPQPATAAPTTPATPNNPGTKLADANPAQATAPQAPQPAKAQVSSVPAYAAKQNSNQEEDEYVDDNTEGNGN